MASDPTTWSELKASLANWLNRDDLTLAEIPEAIALFERRAQRSLFAPEREIVADLTIDAEEVSLPADLWGIKALHLATDPRTVIEPMTPGQLRSTYPANAPGRPRNYALRGETILFGPAPDASYAGKLSYVQTIPALGAAQATNWLLTDHPDVYIEGSLAELYTLLRDVEGMQLFEARCRQSIEEINGSAVRRLQGGAPIRIRPPSLV